MTQLGPQKETEVDPYMLFEYSIRSPYTKESYFRRLRRFFDAISLEGPTFESRCNLFADNGRKDPNWAFNSILKFVLEEKQRVESKKITGGTLRNSVKTIKTFCEVTDVMIPWKKITRGLPRVKRYADDRAPTLEEIRKIFESLTENDWKGFIVANTTLNKIYDDPNLIMNVESFLFQSKSCLDVFAQIIAYSFRFEISTYQDFGDGLIKHLEKISSDHPQDVGKIIEIIGDSISWVKELVEMRNDVTHWSDLDGLSCFFTKQAKEKTC